MACLHSSWPTVFLFTVLAAAGCAGRGPITSRVPPAPQTQPEPAPQPGTAPAPSAKSNPPSRTATSAPPTRSAPFIPGIYVEQGTASWYGVPFNGRRAANGEIFDMNTL